MALTDREKRQRKFERMLDRYKTLTLGSCKRDVAKTFQRMIRIEAADEFGRCQCRTCPKAYEWDSGQIHAGHFVSSRSNGIIFDERNCHCQCIRCNVYLGGNQEKYTEYMLNNYGQEVIDEINQNRNSTVTFTKEELVGMRMNFMDRIKVAEKRLANSNLNWN